MSDQQRSDQGHIISRYCHCMAILLLMAWLSVAVQATPGDLDLTFGSGGKVISPFTEYSDQISSIQVRPDGKIIVSGYSYGYDVWCPCEYEASGFIARYNSSGTLDASFGTDGVVYPVDGVTNSFFSILGFKTVLQPDGKIVLIGRKLIYTAPNQGQIDFAVWRYNSEGTLDTSFGTGGKVSTPVGTLHDWARDVVLQPDGKIVVTGLIGEHGVSAKFATVRYNSDGSLDNNFGTGGKVITSIDGFNQYSQPYSLLLQADGKIVVVGNRENNQSNFTVLIRYNANGSLDPAFGTNGIVIYPQAGYNNGPPVDSLLQPDGKIVARGGSEILRFNASGSVDTSFAAAPTVGKGIALQTDGKIVAFGSGSIPTGVGFAAERFNPDGSLDTSFGSNGRVLTPVGTNGQSFGLAVELQPDGKFLGGGVTNFGEGVGDAAIVRYLLDTRASGFEGDISPRNAGDGVVIATDVVQMRRFAAGLDTPDPASNEFQRADSSPRGMFGDGMINASDVVQARRYAAGLDPLTNAEGPTVAADPSVAAVIGGSVFAKVSELSEMRLVSGTDGVVFVELESGREVAAVSFKLRYDAMKLGKPQVSLGDLPVGAVLTVNDTVEGELTILIDSAEPFGGGGEAVSLIEIVFPRAAVDGLVVFDGEASLVDEFGNDLGVLFKAQKQARY